MIDKKNLFKEFEEGEVNSSPKSSKRGRPSLTIPVNKISTFNRKISSYLKFQDEVSQLIKEETSQLPNFTPKVWEKVMNNAWNSISGINLDNGTHVRALKSFDKKVLCNNIDFAIQCFICTEEYEKCGFLLKISEKVKVF